MLSSLVFLKIQHYWELPQKTGLVPFFHQSTVKCHAFPVAGVTTWNSLPADVTSASSLPVFKNKL